MTDHSSAAVAQQSIGRLAAVHNRIGGLFGQMRYWEVVMLASGASLATLAAPTAMFMLLFIPAVVDGVVAVRAASLVFAASISANYYWMHWILRAAIDRDRPGDGLQDSALIVVFLLPILASLLLLLLQPVAAYPASVRTPALPPTLAAAGALALLGTFALLIHARAREEGTT